ncbi:UxaA family hydrolase [Pseudoroseicyclus sp. CXY001]|uniref:UxaA family hydrolase n=1 Tax=Pseudoroseicyclus sp. CXY001 TaxID=3242492 RepID=UPI0035715E7E
MSSTLLLHPDDDVAIALADLPAGAEVEGIRLSQSVARGHKIALRPRAAGELVRRYGQVIGRATEEIAPGAHVHSHNLGMSAHGEGTAPGAAARALPPPDAPRTFEGYHRADGTVGTRNYIGIVTTVNCSGSVARFIAEAVERQPWFAELTNVDGVVPITHGSGCAMDMEGEGYQTLFRTLQGYIRHPNFGGVLLVGLGCEAMQVPALVGKGRLRADMNFRYMTIQNTGGTRATIEAGVKEVRQMAEVANRATRAPAPLSHLMLGMQCGGSDGYSGITANPALGAASDLLVRHGATTLLSETPEIYGAEHLLTARAASPEVAEKLMARIHWWERYAALHGGQMDNNPSPGNKRGGLTTILEKSLGAVAKSGTAPLADVCLFAERPAVPGFVFMDSPGYDPVSVTGQIAAGSTLIAFTTGRGSVSGFMPTPGLKLATNSEMYARMEGDMDVNCGDVLEGVSIEEKGVEIFEALIAAASGRPTKSEALGFGGAEFVPWQIGAVM